MPQQFDWHGNIVSNIAEDQERKLIFLDKHYEWKGTPHLSVYYSNQFPEKFILETLCSDVTKFEIPMKSWRKERKGDVNPSQHLND